MSHTFRFVGELQPDGSWRLAGDEAQHLAKVLRLPVGAAVEVTDGRGAWAPGTVASAKANDVRIEAGPAHRVAAKTAPFVFAIGALKPGAIDEILPALTELGVDEIWIFQQNESAKARLADKAVERWHRIVLQAVKQCKRAWVPPVMTFASAAGVATAADARGDTLRLVLSPDATETLLARVTHAPGRPLVVACGGEKGLAPEEERALREASFTAVGLGPHVLRAVTAAVAAAAVVASLRP